MCVFLWYFFSCGWYLILQHCGQKRYSKLFPFLKIYQHLICDPGCDLSWRMFHMHLRKMWNPLVWGEMLWTTLNIWNFTDLENFERYFTSMWDECNCVVVWAFFGIAFLWDWNLNWPFPVLGHYSVFQICWHIECSTFTASSFRIWKSSTRIPSPPLAS